MTHAQMTRELARLNAMSIAELSTLIEHNRSLTRDWCECGKDETFGSYPEDGACACGMHKHHVHCGTCGHIAQVG